jgi:hypothetical protein
MEIYRNDTLHVRLAALDKTYYAFVAVSKY